VDFFGKGAETERASFPRTRGKERSEVCRDATPYITILLQKLDIGKKSLQNKFPFGIINARGNGERNVRPHLLKRVRKFSPAANSL
jgi:hypothetical protein